MLYRLGDMKQGLWSTGVTKLTGEDGGIGEQISLCYFVYLVGQDSSVDTATHHRLCGSGIDSRWGRDFLHLFRLALWLTQPPIQWISGLSRG